MNNKMNELKAVTYANDIKIEFINKYNKLLMDNNLDPAMHEPTIEHAINGTKVTVTIGVKPVKRINGIPITDIYNHD